MMNDPGDKFIRPRIENSAFRSLRSPWRYSFSGLRMPGRWAFSGESRRRPFEFQGKTFQPLTMSQCEWRVRLLCEVSIARVRKLKGLENHSLPMSEGSKWQIPNSQKVKTRPSELSSQGRVLRIR